MKANSAFIQLYTEAEVNAKISAVPAEREACAVAADKAIMRVRTDTIKAHQLTLAEFRSVCSCAAEDAIKARGTK